MVLGSFRLRLVAREFIEFFMNSWCFGGEPEPLNPLESPNM